MRGQAAADIIQRHAVVTRRGIAVVVIFFRQQIGISNHYAKLFIVLRYFDGNFSALGQRLYTVKDRIFHQWLQHQTGNF